MKYTLLFLCISGMIFHSNAQTLESFENVTLDSGKVLNGSQGDKEFTFDAGQVDLHLPVTWDTSWGGLWTGGWAISRKYDSVTVSSSASSHLYCTKAFKGYNATNTFVIGQNGSYLYLDRKGVSGIQSFQIANSTYAYNSMKKGDLFAKKFGGTSGKDPDWFLCRVYSYLLGSLLDSQDVYLADYRFADSSKDYMLRDWKQVSLTHITDSLSFKMFGSDTGKYGLNTPAFFALDAISYSNFENVKTTNPVLVSVYPNPASGMVYLNATHSIDEVTVFQPNGKMVLKQLYNANNMQILETSGLSSGLYFLRIKTALGVSDCQLKVQN